MNRLVSAALLCLGLAASGFVAPAARAAALSPAPRPNVLVILADDLGRGDYSAFGTRDIRTPHIDRLFRKGMTFRNFFANSCAWSPSRAALVTGCADAPGPVLAGT